MSRQVSHEEFKKATANYACVTSELLGSRVVAYSDQWFAEAANLIKPNPPVCEVRFVPSGRWYDGWETRRHNPAPSDWVVVELGVASAWLVGCEVDTTFFNGNHAPAISVEAAVLPANGDTERADWVPVIAKHECGPSQRHFFLLDAPTSTAFTHVRLHMYPDGGIARFRMYGKVVPLLPKDSSAIIDTAALANGGVAVSCSDEHFSSADNLLLPGRGVDMSDGWETARSRVPGHVDWVIVRLSAPTAVDHVVVDTAFFRGNYPQAIRVEGIVAENPTESAAWRPLVAETPAGPDKEHVFSGAAILEKTPVSHVKLTIIPDGGVKRLRIFGQCV